MQLKTLPIWPMDENTYVLYGEQGNECIVIDPGDADKVKAFLDEEKLVCTHILLTHGHFDHITGVAALKAATGAKVCIHAADAPMLHDDALSLADTVGLKIEPCQADVLLEDGAVIHAAGFELWVIATPGHSKGGVCYVDEAHHIIFSGDTLFYRSVGRADFPGGNEDELFASITQQLFPLMGDYRVCPGHMEETTLDDERELNPFVAQFSSDT